MVTGEAFRYALRRALTRPFRVVPFFDPGPWGGQWMSDMCGLDKAAPTMPGASTSRKRTRCFRFRRRARGASGDRPGVSTSSRTAGGSVHSRFGAEFPIRFDFLDTMGGGNLSLQVTRCTEYIREKFGMALHAGRKLLHARCRGRAGVYLGLQAGRRPRPYEFGAAGEAAQRGGPALRHTRFVNRYPAEEARSFLIPAGTSTARAGTAWCWRSARRPTFSRSSCGTGAAWASTARPRPDPHRARLANELQWDRDADVRANLVNRVRSRRARRGLERGTHGPARTASSSRRAGTGSPEPCRTTPRRRERAEPR